MTWIRSILYEKGNDQLVLNTTLNALNEGIYTKYEIKYLQRVSFLSDPSLHLTCLIGGMTSHKFNRCALFCLLNGFRILLNNHKKVINYAFYFLLCIFSQRTKVLGEIVIVNCDSFTLLSAYPIKRVFFFLYPM